MTWKTQKPHKSGTLQAAIEDFKTAACRQVAQAYLSLLEKEHGAIPAKNGVDLSGFAAVMPDLVLTAITVPDRCVYRLAGENMKRRVGLDPIGRNYYDFVPEERRAQAARAMNMVVEIPCAFRAEIEQSYSDGRARNIEAIALPLRSEEPEVDGFILFGDREFETSDRIFNDGVTLLGANVLRRDLIDLGFGVDDSFEDIVPG